MHRHDHIRLDTLATVLELRRNAVWAFQQHLHKHWRAAAPLRAAQQVPLLDFGEAIRLHHYTTRLPPAQTSAKRAPPTRIPELIRPDTLPKKEATPKGVASPDEAFTNLCF